MSTLRKSETQDKEFENIELFSIQEILELINKQDQEIADIVKNSISQIEKLSYVGIDIIKNNGRIIYLGSGASGDIASSDAQEIHGTYGVPFETFRCVHLQLGPNKDWQNLKDYEFANRNTSEDGENQLINDLKSINFTKNDLIIGISASGETKTIINALRWAKFEGAKTACVVMNNNSSMEKITEYSIIAVTGAEVISGSTRMKCATATKMILNMFSTTIMIKSNNVYKGLMVGLIIPKEGNSKLVNRAENMISKITGVANLEAKKLFKESNQNIKLAIIIKLKNTSLKNAQIILESNNYDLRKILN